MANTDYSANRIDLQDTGSYYLTKYTEDALQDIGCALDGLCNIGSKSLKLAMRPAFTAGRIAGVAKPTAVAVGPWSGYSFPIYNNDDEELFWRLHVPGRWDGTTDIEYWLTVCLSAAETEGDDFKFQLSWSNSTGTTGVITTDVVSPTADGDCSAGHTAQYSIFRLGFTIDVSAGPIVAVSPGDILAGRVRRIASGGVEVSNEIIVLDHWINFTVDKIFKT